MNPRATATLLALLALSGCGTPAKKPANADIAAYLAQSEPGYLRISDVTGTFESISTLGSSKLPDGSWRVQVNFTLHANEDLYAPVPGTADRRAEFNRAVASVEAMRVARIAAVERLAQQLGLMQPGATAPEPATSVAIVSHAKSGAPDQVSLLAEPDGAGWKFVQLSPQTLGDDSIGAPLADLKRTHPHTAYVIAGSTEEREYLGRTARFLATLAKAPAP